MAETRQRAGRLRRWLFAWLAVSAFNAVVLGAAAFLYAFVIEPNRVVLERVSLKRTSRSGGTGEVRIAHISDLDLSRPPGYRERRARRLIEAEGAHLVAFSGDLIANVAPAKRLPLLGAGLDYLGSLSSEHGTFIVLGEEGRGFRREIEGMLPENVFLVEDGAIPLKTGDLDVLVCGPNGHFPEIGPVNNHLGPVLLLGEGASRRRRLYVAAGSGAWKNYEITGRVRVTRRGDALGIVFYAGEEAGVARGYELSIPQGENRFRLREIAGKLGGEKKGYTPFLQTDRWYRFRVRAETLPATSWVRSRVWPEGEPEPSEWQGDLADGTPERSRAGTVGVVTGGWESGREKYLDDLLVTPVAGGPPLLSEGFDDPARFAAEWPGPNLEYRRRDLVVIVCHSPEYVRGLHYTEKVDLILAGHTHGGQAVLPFFGPVRASLVSDPNLYTGTHRIGGPVTLHINRGIGTAILPARINCPPEVTLLEVRVTGS